MPHFVLNALAIPKLCIGIPLVKDKIRPGSCWTKYGNYKMRSQKFRDIQRRCGHQLGIEDLCRAVTSCIEKQHVGIYNLASFNDNVGNYYEPDFEDLSRQMRNVYTNYEKYKQNISKNIVSFNNKKITKFIINEINKDNLIREKFYKKTKNRKYTCKQLCYSLFYLFKSGSSFRKFDDNTQYIKIFNKNLKYKLPNWNTIYKFYIKLIKYDIICKTFIETTKKIKKSKYYIVDTTLICNKGGIDNVGYNIQLPKHKTTKISIISNENKILDVQLAYWLTLETTLSELSVQLFSGNLNDAGILDKQLNIFNNFQPNSNNILLGDSGYDSNNIRNKLKNMKYGKLLTHKNKRNTKDKKN